MEDKNKDLQKRQTRSLSPKPVINLQSLSSQLDKLINDFSMFKRKLETLRKLYNYQSKELLSPNILST